MASERYKEIAATLSEGQEPIYRKLIQHAIRLEEQLEVISEQGVFNRLGGVNDSFTAYRQTLIVYAEIMGRIGRAAKTAAAEAALDEANDKIASWMAGGLEA